MNPMQQIATTLAGRGPWLAAQPSEGAPKRVNKTEAMRNYLRANGKATAPDLAMEADVEQTGLVGALLKTDLQRGRIFMRDGRYHWNPEHDERQAAEVRQAIALLKRQGYKVLKP